MMKTLQTQSRSLASRQGQRTPALSRIAGLVLLVVASAQAVAGDLPENEEPGTYVAYAEVVQADPIVEVVREPVATEICRAVPSSHRSKTPVVVGGIIGGLIGNQFGSGRGRTATTIAGTALGASVGADHSRKRSRERSGVQRCEATEHYREYERIAGYRVTYRYDGETYTTETKEHPGTHLKLELSAASS